MGRKNKCRSIDAIDIKQQKNLIGSLKKLIVEKSK